MCMAPLKIYWDRAEHKYMFNPKDADITRFAIVPCGKCPECKKKWRTSLAQRVRHELTKYSPNEVCFLTLTVSDMFYQDAFPGGSLCHTYFQKFIKRLRRHLEYRGFTGKIKYLVCGEYGHEEGRAHYHCILFGFKPNDLKYAGMSKKKCKCFKSEMLQRLWSKPRPTKKELEEFNNDPNYEGMRKKLDPSGILDYIPFGYLDVGEVNENTAPYMAKYLAKFSEIDSSEFTVNGVVVRKPYLVYPKKILGLDFFLENYRQILINGFVYTSEGQKVGIPRSYLAYAEKSDDILMQELYLEYKRRMEDYILECNRELMQKHGLHWTEIYDYHVQQGKIKREIYNSFKNKNR